MNNPLMKDVEPGTYYWCTCGKTKTTPYCDDSHKGTSKQPLQIVIVEKRTCCAVHLQQDRDPALL